MREKATINDVAQKANVSIATVSRVINNLGTVKESTKERVLQAMQLVGYEAPLQDNQWAQPRNKIVLILLPDMGSNFFGGISEGICTVMEGQGYECTAYWTRGGASYHERVIQLARSLNVSGIITVLSDMPLEISERLNRICPVVQCYTVNEDGPLPYITVNNYEAQKNATNYLIEKGRKRIALLGGSLNWDGSRKREEAYMDALREAGLEVNPNLIARVIDFSYETLYTEVKRLLQQEPKPDAVLTAQDKVAAVVLKVAAEMGLSVPQDLAVMGFDNGFLSWMTTPALTTMAQQPFRMGELAAKMLLTLIEGGELTSPQIKFNAELVIRESC